MLAWVAGDGWGQFWERKGEPWSDFENAEAFRNRHLLGSMKALASITIKRR